jgi:hypothetical protein
MKNNNIDVCTWFLWWSYNSCGRGVHACDVSRSLEDVSHRFFIVAYPNVVYTLNCSPIELTNTWSPHVGKCIVVQTTFGEVTKATKSVMVVDPTLVIIIPKFFGKLYMPSIVCGCDPIIHFIQLFVSSMGSLKDG